MSNCCVSSGRCCPFSGGCPKALPDKTDGTILLVGNPNVGKSALFSRLTGVHAISSNYPGTTIGFTEGFFRRGESVWRIIDVPGAYTLDPTNEAEEVARRIVDEGADLVIIALDATALERNLYMALQVLESGARAIVALNMADEARHQGICVNVEALSRELGVPVVPTVAVTGSGISEMVEKLSEASQSAFPPMESDERWKTIGAIVEKCQTATCRRHTLRDRLEDISVHPFWGGLLGVLVVTGSFFVIRQIGEGIIGMILDPLYSGLFMPILDAISGMLAPGTFIHQVVIGSLINGAIDPGQSFGLLSTGLYVPIVMVLPYVVAFYAVLSLLEDVGYLPRLAILFDALLHRLGLHGFAIIPNLLGLGCNVPGILATRVLESARERFIAATLISVAVPCAGLQAMILGVLGPYGGGYVLTVYASMFVTWVVLGRLLHKLLPGYSPELVVEIPPYRAPSFRDLGLKLWFRVKGFLIEAVPLVLAGVLLVNLLYYVGAVDALSRFLEPVFTGFLGLPASAAGPIFLGLLRKDVAVGMLAPLGLSPEQLVVAMVVLSMTFPCIATFAVFWKELGFRKVLMSLGLMMLCALRAGKTVMVLMSLAG
ncbi:MAG: ferrous iron transporter B [Synergistota bacterium]|nr:ferrous iron transporter B [Synergistota bacterium]